MGKINKVRLGSLEQTRAFYLWELKKEESLTENEKDKYLMALKSIEKIIKEKKESGEKDKKIISQPTILSKDKYFSKRGY